MAIRHRVSVNLWRPHATGYSNMKPCTEKTLAEAISAIAKMYDAPNSAGMSRLCRECGEAHIGLFCNGVEPLRGKHHET